MNMKTTMKIMLMTVCLLMGLTMRAQDTKSQFNPIEHAVISQTIAPDARSAGMGDVGAATDPDVNSQAWNIAKYPFCISRAGIALNYTPWLRQLVNDIDLAYVAGYYRVGDNLSLSGSLRYFSLGEVMTSFEENAMYTKYAERGGWKFELLDLSESELGGVKEAVFSLSGDDVFSRMKFESGVHRVQRVPVTEASGRIHTSTITVSVLPEAEEMDDIVLSPDDLEISTFRSSGPGGQNVNRTDSAVRIVHKPSGITVASQQERSQIRNREIAMRILKSKLLEIRQREEARKHADSKRQQVGTGDRSERIRTYNFPQSRVTDHRYGISAYDLPGLMEGDLDQILDPVLEEEGRKNLEFVLKGA